MKLKLIDKSAIIAEIKSYTNLEQSEKLKEKLPIESADMYYHYNTSVVKNYYEDVPKWVQLDNHFVFFDDDIPCWSTSALLEIIRNNGRYELQMYEGGYYFEANGFMTESYFNPIDACYEMIIKLHEQKLI